MKCRLPVGENARETSGEEEHYDNEERIEKSACVHGDVPCRTNQVHDGQVRRGRDGEVGRAGTSSNDGII